MDYQFTLENFRGPLDLLLFLVKRSEVDVCDIPIAQLTEQFLGYVQVMEVIDVERAGDFLVMAATLMEIKSRTLLPRADEEGQEEDDPRRELVRQLMEYKAFKDAAAQLEAQAERQSWRLGRTSAPPPGVNPAQQPLRQVELWDLVSAFGRLMRETLALQPQQIVVDQTPIQVYMQQILDRLEQEPSLPFAALFTPPQTRSRLVGLFLALLELIKGRRIQVEQPEAFGEIRLSRMAPEAAAVSVPEGDSSAPNPGPDIQGL
jgi:segregation and condensation protein A